MSGAFLRAVVNLGAIETTVITRQLCSANTGVVVTPKCCGLIPIHPQIELALGIHIAGQCGIITINWIEAVGVNSTEQLPGVASIQIFKNFGKFIFASIHLRG